MVREDLDVVSVRYRLLNGPSVPVSSLSPTLLLLNLNTGMDSGGSLVVNLLLNKVLMGGIVSPWQGLCPLGRARVPLAGLVPHAPRVVGTSGTISLFLVVTKYSEPFLAASSMSHLSAPIQMPQPAACGGSDAEETKWKAAAVPSSPWEPGTLPPGEEAEQGNPGMFLSKSLIPRLLQ